MALHLYTMPSSPLANCFPRVYPDSKYSGSGSRGSASPEHALALRRCRRRWGVGLGLRAARGLCLRREDQDGGQEGGGVEQFGGCEGAGGGGLQVQVQVQGGRHTAEAASRFASRE